MRRFNIGFWLSPVLLLFHCLFGVGISSGQVEPPYPPSPIIEAVEWDFGTLEQYGIGSDLWPMTWGDDGNVYASWGDGWGFNGDLGPKQFIGVSRILGEPPGLTGEDVWGIPITSYPEAKPQAIAAYDDMIYLFYDRYYEDRTYSWPAWSSDNGNSFERGAEPVFRADDDGSDMIVRGICQFGPGYAGAPDSYVYVYFAAQYGDKVFLGRAPRAEIFNRQAYTFFAGMSVYGLPLWSPALSDKVTVFEDPNRFIWHISVSYNAGLDRYLLTKPHFAEGDTEWRDVASIGVFDSPTPWGPWTTVCYQDDFFDDETKFNYIVPTKYISQDGLTFWLAWSGWPYYDNVTFVEATLGLSTSIDEDPGNLAAESGVLRLLQARPNPFSRGTEVLFDLLGEGDVEVGIMNTGGERVRTLWEGRSEGRLRELFWDGRNDEGRRVAGGVYFVRLERKGGGSMIRKIIFLR